MVEFESQRGNRDIMNIGKKIGRKIKQETDETTENLDKISKGIAGMVKKATDF